MPDRLPPLNALRAFEAAGRYLSFTRAAGELHVTPAAISHQVKQLEDYLGAKLFRRLTRELRLTEEGQALLPGLREAFERMGQAVRQLTARDTQGLLTVTTITTFALAWLVPRLPRFQAQYPDIEVRLMTAPRLVDFAREDVDAAIRYGRGHWPGLRADKLIEDMLTPLCGPAYRDRLRTPEDLRNVPLIDQYDDPTDWTIWLAAAGLKNLGRSGRATFDSTRVSVQAAMDGLGVAIGAPALFAGEIAAGRLFQPFPLVVPNDKAYWLVYPEASAERPKIKAFRDWTLAEIAADADAPPMPAAFRADKPSGRAAATSRRSAKAGHAPGRDDGSDD
ncbi:MAG: transcriptional regulator GcvA [Rhodospirillales bacterium]|nr:transcriptional regulator GcvA [Rhodospirillales bacterium]